MKSPENLEIISLDSENEQLKKRISYLESILSEIQMLNALGKTLKIDEAIKAAIDE